MFDNRGEMQFQSTYETTSMRQYVLRTFLTMGLGLLLTAIVAFVMYQSGLALRLLYANPYLPLVLLAVEIGVVVAFVTRIRKFSANTAKILFAFYAVLTGVVFSTLGYAYDPSAIFAAFAVTAVYFGSLVTIGYTTKVNLLRYGPLLMAALITFIVAQVVMFFLGMSMETKLISVIGLVIFTGITAYDAQKMKKLYELNEGNEQAIATMSIYSAFELYLDFINLFLYILRLLAKRN